MTKHSPGVMKRGVLREIAHTLFHGVGHSLWKALEIDSDQTLHVYIVKHDPFGPAKVVVGVSIALHALLLALSRRDLHSKTKSRPPRGPRSA